jgi:hypothetical protein
LRVLIDWPSTGLRPVAARGTPPRREGLVSNWPSLGQALQALLPAAVEADATNGRATPPRMTNKRYGLWGLIASPQAAPAYAASVVGAERPGWSPYEDPRATALADGFHIIVAAHAVTLGEEQAG